MQADGCKQTGDPYVPQVISVQPSAAEQLSVELCESILTPVRPAIEGLGGSVKVCFSFFFHTAAFLHSYKCVSCEIEEFWI